MLFFNICSQAYYDSRVLRSSLKNIVFIRLLTQDKIAAEDKSFSRILIHEFLNDFKSFYGAQSHTFTYYYVIYIVISIYLIKLKNMVPYIKLIVFLSRVGLKTVLFYILVKIILMAK